jgi:hypothetical protein
MITFFDTAHLIADQQLVAPAVIGRLSVAGASAQPRQLTERVKHEIRFLPNYDISAQEDSKRKSKAESHLRIPRLFCTLLSSGLKRQTLNDTSTYCFSTETCIPDGSFFQSDFGTESGLAASVGQPISERSTLPLAFSTSLS